MKQVPCAVVGYDARKNRTKGEKFLTKMEQVLPWARSLPLIDPHYPKAELGRRRQMPRCRTPHPLVSWIPGPTLVVGQAEQLTLRPADHF
jgi:hypothetical protein